MRRRPLRRLRWRWQGAGREAGGSEPSGDGGDSSRLSVRGVGTAGSRWQACAGPGNRTNRISIRRERSRCCVRGLWHLSRQLVSAAHLTQLLVLGGQGITKNADGLEVAVGPPLLLRQGLRLLNSGRRGSPLQTQGSVALVQFALLGLRPGTLLREGSLELLRFFLKAGHTGLRTRPLEGEVFLQLLARRAPAQEHDLIELLDRHPNGQRFPRNGRAALGTSCT
mmetsp:Transcript_65410/g.165758  ORF Transcript_65410/g.165758 Transcript_65410/m.165758 type:complete len:224 (-) Transcript_65410:24-695(-)